MNFQQRLLSSWRKPNILTVSLLPLSLLYFIILIIRNQLYRLGLLKSYRAPVPVIVVGNITVGGTGKTPLVICLVEQLRNNGFTPGVISRGYAGKSKSLLLVDESTPVNICGDEPALIVKRTKVPLVVGSDRQADIELLLAKTQCDIIISDDGLQHIAMQRDVEICIVDATNPSENQFLLPAGAYREPLSRLNSVDFVLHHIDPLMPIEKGFNMWLQPNSPKLVNDHLGQELSMTVNAVAGIGNPARFFKTCRDLGYEVIEHVFTDHHAYQAQELQFSNQLPVLMTEKDAIKCTQFAQNNHWYLPVDAKLSDGFIEKLIALIKKRNLTQGNHYD